MEDTNSAVKAEVRPTATDEAPPKATDDAQTIAMDESQIAAVDDTQGMAIGDTQTVVIDSKSHLGGGVALGAAGIGRETAFALAEAGIGVLVIADLNEDAAEATCKEAVNYATQASFRSFAAVVDVTDEARVNEVVQSTVEDCGRIDYCVHCAGIGDTVGGPIENVTTDAFANVLMTNAKGTMLVLRAVSRAMAQQVPRRYQNRRSGQTRDLGRGAIVVLASAQSFVPAPGSLSYTAAKHAVIGVMKTAALDNMKNNIRINAICPSWVDTPMTQADMLRIPELQHIIQTFSPLGRAATPDEVADYAVFLCSPSASYINGTSLLIDAGITLTAHGAASL